ncbi:hypothetical protein CAL26_06030 [Bordetella genomosp. 9]|uniref:Uncharacterized protein n=1 Tax=Bordetella genomosp. 9 TaxID=1416803 RepID=A0A261RG25_9BORD|nr:hypothetical protein CAL26_06030 [Bordetella genomosp. 9]
MNLRLSPQGLYRWRDIKPLVGVGRETWRRLVNAKRAPQPLHIGPRCTVWRGTDLIAWLSAPGNYSASA